MNILHFVMLPEFSGVDMLVGDLSLIHAAGGHRVAIASFGPCAPTFASHVRRMEDAGVKWLIPAQMWRRWSRIRGVRQVVGEFHPDAVFCHTEMVSAYVRGALFLSRRPAVIRVMHSRHESLNDKKMRMVERLLARRTNAIICVAQAQMDYYRQQVGSHPGLIFIPNGIHLQAFRSAAPSRSSTREQMGWEETRRVVLQVGRLTAVKRHHLTIHALAPLLRDSSDTVLALVGVADDLPYIEQLHRRAGELGIENRIQFLGPRADVPALLSAADVYVMPSEREGHSLALLEAMASGLPIVASNIDSFSFARSFPGVDLIDPTDSAAFRAAVISRLEKRERFTRDLSSYDIKQTAQSYLTLLQKLVPTA